MVLAQKETYRSMEQNREPRNKTHTPTDNLQQRKQEYTMEVTQSSKWHWKNWTATCKSMI